MRVLVTGAAGLLGAAVLRGFRDDDLHAFDRTSLDVTDAAAVSATVARVAPDVVINCAAFNDVDAAEARAAEALLVNAMSVHWLARAAQEAGARLVHYSSDFVFDGTGNRPYTEEDGPAPRSVYGASKLLGDWLALEYPRAYVLRVESLFGEPGRGGRRGSLGVIVDKVRRGEEVAVFIDRTVSPSFTGDVARATRELLAGDAPAGLYHCVNAGSATWAEIAAEVAGVLQRPFNMRPLTLATAALKAPRPLYCALSNGKLADAGVVMPDWRDALRTYLSQSRTPVG